MVGWGFAGLQLLIWVSFHLIARLYSRDSLTPWDLLLLRALGGFLAALPLLVWRGPPRLPPRRMAAVVALAGFGFPIGAYAGYALAPTAHGALLLAGSLPLVLALLGWALGWTRIGWRRWLSLAGIVAGTALLTLSGGTAAGPGAWIGDLLFIAGNTAWALYTLLAARWRLSAVAAAMSFGLCVAPLYVPVFLLFDLPSNLARVPWSSILFNLVFQGMLSGVLNGIIYTECVRRLGAGTTTLVGAMVPAIAASLAWPLLGETLGPPAIAGIALVTLATLAGARWAGR